MLHTDTFYSSNRGHEELGTLYLLTKDVKYIVAMASIFLFLGLRTADPQGSGGGKKNLIKIRK